MAGKSSEGQNATYDFIQEVWIEKALIQTRMLPAMLERERQNYQKQLKLLEEIGHKGKYTGTTGWSQGQEYKFSFSLSPHVYQYFANIVGPYLDCGKELWADANSKMWKRIKKMVIDGDKVEIAKLQKDIERRLLKQSGLKIQGAISGIKAKDTSPGKDTPKDNIQ